MSDDTKNNDLLSKRVFASLCCLFILFVLLLIRLFFLQILNGQKYSLLSDKNRICTTYTAAKRGVIYDRKGAVLAISKLCYQAALDFNQYENNAKSWETLCKCLTLNPKIPISTYIQQQLKSSGTAHVVLIKDNLSWEEILMCEQLAFQIPGIVVIPKIVRFYPYAKSTCHVVGYVTRPTVKDIQRNANLKILGAAVGKLGIEQSFDNVLQGTIGIKQVEMNAMRHIVRIIDDKAPECGGDVHLTIDIELQEKIVCAMSNVRSGAAVVINIKTGEILASVSLPAIDTNIFTEHISQAQWANIASDADYPLLNRVISGVYSPGSTFKTIVAVAALNEKTIDENSKFYCCGYYDLKSARFHCWRWRIGGHGNMNITQAIAQSCDVFFYNVAFKLGVSPILSAAKNFGLGVKFDIGLGDVKAVGVPQLGMFKKQFGQAINLSIGQGQLIATPLQLAVMTARIASGRMVVPKLVAKTPYTEKLSHAAHSTPQKVSEGPELLTRKALIFNSSSDCSEGCENGTDLQQPTGESEQFAELPYSKGDLSLVVRGMREVISGALGTAHHLRNKAIHGKTGSSQVCSITMDERKKGKLAERPYQLKDHALFIGFSGDFAVAVVVEHGESGSRVAAPIGEAAFNALLQLGYKDEANSAQATQNAAVIAKQQ